jgi:predicted pyridoxine 5'-phosphate oxidase superfamily flavin-nucleotide-binding protein
VDAEGQPCASILSNPPGFIGSPDARHLLIRARPLVADPLHETLASGANIALLGIEQHTRRRNRMNGIVERIDDTGVLVGVQQSFGNCPKYIQTRQADYVDIASPDADHSATVHSTPALNEQTRHMIARADTFFIAIAHPDSSHVTARSQGAVKHGVDVSHRGGKPGFVRVDDGTTLTIPDFAGNRFFNTLGNITLNPRAGLLFIDFESGDLLYLAVDAEIIFDGPERLLRLSIRHVRHLAASLPLRWHGEVEISPFLAHTGSWNPA